MSSMTYEGRTYRLILGSDVQADGMYLELSDESSGESEAVADWFYSDVDGSMAFTEYRAGIPAPVLAWLEMEARRRLPPEPPAV